MESVVLILALLRSSTVLMQTIAREDEGLYSCESTCVIFAPCYINFRAKIVLNDVICIICYIVPLTMES